MPERKSFQRHKNRGRPRTAIAKGTTLEGVNIDESEAQRDMIVPTRRSAAAKFQPTRIRPECYIVQVREGRTWPFCRTQAATWTLKLPDLPVSPALGVFPGRRGSNGSHSFLADPGLVPVDLRGQVF